MATINVHRSPRRRFTARAIKDSRRVVKILSLAGAKDHEAKLVLGHYCDEPGLIAAVVDRKTQANQQVIELDGAIVVLPPRMLKKLPVAFDTIEDHARKLGMRRLLKSLAPTHPRRPSRRQRRLTGD
jgi:hypothetical protein